MVVITLKSLPIAFEHFIETFNITTAYKDLKFEGLSTKLLQQNKRKMQFGSSSKNESSIMALATNFKGKGKFSRRLKEKTKKKAA